jgi:hypothetical protein
MENRLGVIYYRPENIDSGEKADGFMKLSRETG